jgi:acyl carrier protein
MKYKLLKFVADKVPGTPVSIDMSISELGLDSLEFIELIQAFENEFHAVVPDEDVIQINTIADLVRYLPA